MTDATEPLEDLAAGTLNGVMILLLGAAFPALVVWRVATNPGRLNVPLNTDSLFQAIQVIGPILLSLWLVRCGARLARTNIGALLRRRRSTPAG